MTFVLYTNIVSPHLLALARILARSERIKFLYIYTEQLPDDALKRGWRWSVDEDWMLYYDDNELCADNYIRTCDVLLSGIRDADLFLDRLREGRKTFYMSERWFKPFHGLPGWIRLINPRYYMLARKIAQCFKSHAFVYLPIGPLAALDMRLICCLNCFFGSSKKMLPWAYFVEPSEFPGRGNRPVHSPMRILWVGRMLGWKRVDTIVKAVAMCENVRLTLVGQGPMREKLEIQAEGLPVDFVDGVPITEVRKLMRDNDVYVLSSDSNEGWGAALSEALEEGMIGLGTFEAGSSAAMLPDEYKFHAGDHVRLVELLKLAAQGKLAPTGIGSWSASAASERILREL